MQITPQYIFLAIALTKYALFEFSHFLKIQTKKIENSYLSVKLGELGN